MVVEIHDRQQQINQLVMEVHCVVNLKNILWAIVRTLRGALWQIQVLIY